MALADRWTRAVKRFDSWVNTLTGVGSDRGRSSFEFDPVGRMDDQTLENLFEGDAYASRICRCVPEEALRRGFTIRADMDDTTSLGPGRGGSDLEVGSRILAEFNRLHLPSKIIEAWTWGRVYGGGALVMGCDDGRDPKEPLDLKALRAVTYVQSVDKRELYPVRWFMDPRKPNFGEPEVYQLTIAGGIAVGTFPIHASRIIRFDGAMTNRKRRMQNASWSTSELLRVYSALSKFNGGYEAVALLLQEASQGVFKIKDFYEKIASDGGDALKTRMELMDVSRSVYRAIVVDNEDEDFERVDVGALSFLPETLRLFILLLAGASEIPVTILMGQAPAGLSATGDADVRQYYGRVASARMNYLTPRLLRAATILCAANEGPTGGRVPVLSATYPPMWEATPPEDADLKLKVAQADQIYLTTQVATPEEIATSRFRPEGWSAETTIDLDVREKTKEADATTATGPAVDPEHADTVAGIVERVASKSIPRETGLQMLQTMFGLSPEQADATLAGAGGEFTQGDEEHDKLKAEHAKLKASHTGTKNMLTSVLAQNRAGVLVKGSPIAKKVVQTAEAVDQATGGDAPNPTAPDTGASVTGDEPPAPETDPNAPKATP